MVGDNAFAPIKACAPKVDGCGPKMDGFGGPGGFAGDPLGRGDPVGGIDGFLELRTSKSLNVSVISLVAA